MLKYNFEFDNQYAFPEVIVHEFQRSGKFEYLYCSFVYSVSDDAVYCINCAMFLFVEKQRRNKDATKVAPKNHLLFLILFRANLMNLLRSNR